MAGRFKIVTNFLKVIPFRWRSRIKWRSNRANAPMNPQQQVLHGKLFAGEG